MLDFHLRNSNLFKINLLFNTKYQENIILGPSKSLTGINSKLLSTLTHKKWYNFSMDKTEAETHILFLKVLINLKKAPKHILLQYDCKNSYSDSTTFFTNDYQLLPFINNNIIISNYFRPKSNYLVFKYLPIFKYFYYNTELLFPSLMLFFKHDYTHRFELSTGDYSYPDDYIVRYPLQTSKKIEHQVILLKNPIINEFDSLCRKNSAILFLYSAPMYRVHIKTDIVKKYFFDFSDLYTAPSKFIDNIHLSNKSKNDFTIELSKIFNTSN